MSIKIRQNISQDHKKIIQQFFKSINSSEFNPQSNTFQCPNNKLLKTYTDRYLFSLILKATESWSIEYFDESQTSKVYPDIMNTISGVTFDSLTFLVLHGQDIQSIQPLTWLHCPRLVILELNQNDITSLKALQKAQFGNLERLDLSANHCPFSSIQWISRMKCPKLKFLETCFFIQSMRSLGSELICDMSPLAKVQTINYTILKHVTKNIAINFKVCNSMRKKFHLI